MLVSCNWLRDYVDLTIPIKELGEALTMAGLELDAIDILGEGIDRVVVGQIERIDIHPNDPNLYLCEVNTGSLHQIVCGAKNIREGDKVPVALNGAELPIGRTIKRADVKGVTSEGMLCSGVELGLEGEDESGILILPRDYEIGADIKESAKLYDEVFDFDLKSNFAHCLSIIGVAREVRAITKGELRLPKIEILEEGESIHNLSSVTIEDYELCPRYTGRIIKGVTIGPSPLWMRQRLRSVGIRPINNVVDCTNYVMMEMGQPIHAFDYNTLRERRIIVRRALPGERLITLDGVDRELDSEVLVIADPERAIALAGVMGGLDTEIKEDTEDVFLEAAYFNPISIRRTERRLSLPSEAARRFEWGIDPRGVVRALNRVAQLIKETAGGSILAGVIDERICEFEPSIVLLRPERANALLDTNLSKEEIIGYLRDLNFEVEEDQEVLKVTVPTFRGDVKIEADLIEEVARAYGYDRIGTTLLRGDFPPARRTRWQELRRKTRNILVSCGMTEVNSYSFTNPSVFGKLRLAEDDEWRRAKGIQNPMREEFNILRTSLIPPLLDVVSFNLRQEINDIPIFEIGKVFLAQGDDIPEEHYNIGASLVGMEQSGLWDRKLSPIDFFSVKGIIETLLNGLGVEGYTFHPSNRRPLHPGHSAEVKVGDEVLGFLGELHPEVAEAYELPTGVYVFELNAEIILSCASEEKEFQALSRYPKVSRDMALLVPLSVTAEQVEKSIANSAGDILEGLRLFDVYQGEQVPSGYKSLAFSLTYRASDRTLKDEEIDEVHQAILKELEERLGARLR